jgi:hypothetical protein
MGRERTFAYGARLVEEERLDHTGDYSGHDCYRSQCDKFVDGWCGCTGRSAQEEGLAQCFLLSADEATHVIQTHSIFVLGNYFDVIVKGLYRCIIACDALSITSPIWRATVKLLDLSDNFYPIWAP